VPRADLTGIGLPRCRGAEACLGRAVSDQLSGSTAVVALRSVTLAPAKRDPTRVISDHDFKKPD